MASHHHQYLSQGDTIVNFLLNTTIRQRFLWAFAILGVIAVGSVLLVASSLNEDQIIPVLGVMIVAISMAGVVGLIIAASILQPLNQVAINLEEIANGDGDLSRRIEVQGSDELAALATSFNQFTDKIQSVISQVTSSSNQLAAAATETSNTTREASMGMQSQQSETEQVATAIEEVSATGTEINQNAVHSVEAAADAFNEAKTGQTVVVQVISSINNLASDVSRAADVIQRLEQDSESIGTVLEVIRGIAEQTNLLALNAAIEAARAGEQGRGFAVVADEVRTLASRTQESTQEIQEIIERLQGGTANAVKVMANSQELANASVEEAEKAGSSLEAITQSVDKIKGINQSIAQSISEQNQMTNAVRANITNINTVTERTAGGAQQTATASENVAELARGLQQIVGSFKG